MDINHDKRYNDTDEEYKELMSLAKNYDDLHKHLSQYMPDALLQMAAQLLCRREKSAPYSSFDLELVIIDVLHARERQLNNGWFFTEHDHERFLKISNELYDVCQKGWNEALKTARELELRMEQGDDFLRDYEIKVCFRPYSSLDQKGIDEDLHFEAVSYFAEEFPYTYFVDSIRHHSYAENAGRIPFCLDKSMNWNCEYFDGEFDNDYISYPIHIFLDEGIWSFSDICLINNISIDVKVEHQHFREYHEPFLQHL